MTNSQIILQTPLFWICNRSCITVYFSAAWRITVPSLLQEAREKLTDAMECNSVCVCMTVCTSYLENSDLQPIWWKNFGVQIAKEAESNGNCKLFLSIYCIYFYFFNLSFWSFWFSKKSSCQSQYIWYKLKLSNTSTIPCWVLLSVAHFIQNGYLQYLGFWEHRVFHTELFCSLCSLKASLRAQRNHKDNFGPSALKTSL